MEKFGIFNILSALSSISSQNWQNEKVESEKKSHAQPQNDAKSSQSQATSASNFSAQTPWDSPQSQAQATEKSQNADKGGIFSGEERKKKMLEVLLKHEQISKRIDKKNSPR